MTNACIFWIIAAVVFAVAECATVALVTVWFALGAVAAAAAAQFGLSVPVQAAVFVIVSALLLCLTRPFVKKIGVKRIQKTNADRFIGRTGIVTKAIEGINGDGQVTVDGTLWTAISESGEPIGKDGTVEVIRISGVKLVVRPAPVTAPKE